MDTAGGGPDLKYGVRGLAIIESHISQGNPKALSGTPHKQDKNLTASSHLRLAP
jgi:hypothetical protein